MDNQRGSFIILLEDDPGMRESLQFLLETYGFKSLAFSIPEEIINRLDDLHHASCAIIDVHLPGADGLAVYSIISTRLPDLPVIFITAHINDNITSSTQTLNAAALLEKPFPGNVLLEAVERALTPAGRLCAKASLASYDN